MKRSVVGLVALLGLVLPHSAAGAFTARGSVEQVSATGLTAGARTTLVDRRGRTVRTKRADDLGGLLFRGVRPGKGYRVRSGGERSGALTVLTDRAAPPSTDLYDQEMP